MMLNAPKMDLLSAHKIGDKLRMQVGVKFAKVHLRDSDEGIVEHSILAEGVLTLSKSGDIEFEVPNYDRVWDHDLFAMRPACHGIHISHCNNGCKLHGGRSQYEVARELLAGLTFSHFISTTIPTGARYSLPAYDVALATIQQWQQEQAVAEARIAA